MADTHYSNQKFSHPDITAKGETRASVAWTGLKTLWFNTGTLCNVECRNCYILSSPKNDRLVYLTLADVMPYLNEIDRMTSEAVEIGITGGEPFMCPDILPIMEAILFRGHSLLFLTNAMRPMMRPRIQEGLQRLRRNGLTEKLILRVSLDSHDPALHDAERGEGAFEEACNGLRWLAEEGFTVAIAGRQSLHEDEAAARAAYGALATSLGLSLDPADPKQLVLFPEMIARDDPPEITTECWGILGKSPESIMCADQRMVIRRKGSARASVTACTLLVDDPAFELGHTLKEATAEPVKLNHPWCASFCVLGGGSCSA
ncbi:radical SAM protein [uncultured Hyphomonas sp.]|uniref:radical SAM protein n=1 Tax=uncultured Hyphomonas sp. TaxID=225298 RepID=UPI002AABB395|nr:radical SAM protein [uncultured Hyphomonas sp.]